MRKTNVNQTYKVILYKVANALYMYSPTVASIILLCCIVVVKTITSGEAMEKFTLHIYMILFYCCNFLHRTLFKLY